MKLLVFLLVMTASVQSQVIDILPFSLNQEPGDFYYIENDLAKIVFKKQYQARAFRALSAITSHSENIQKGFLHQSRKVTIFLRSKTMQSNGFVALAPFKSEFFDAPYIQGQLDLGEWMEMLAIHEYRHVAQLSQRTEGFTQIISVLLGEYGVALTNLWSVPLWVFEGDATRAETMYTKYGRGRNADFSRRFRATLNEDLGYEELYIGTPYQFVPDFYKFGYFFLEYLSQRYEFRAEVAFSETSRNSYNPFSFQNAIKNHTGKSMNKLVDEFISFYQKKWSRTALDSSLESGNEISGEDTFETDYRFPFINSLGALFFVKSGISDVKKIQRDKITLHKPGSFVSNFMNYDEDTMYWIETRRHWRYDTMSENIICKLETVSNKTHLSDQECFMLTGRETSYDQVGSLSVVSLFNGVSSIVVRKNDQKILELKASLNSLFINPQFRDLDHIVYLYKSESGDFSIREYSLLTKKEQILYSAGRVPIRRHRIFDSNIYFESELSSVEEIYEFNIKTQKLRRLTNSKIASLYPFVADEQLYFSRMTNDGLKVFKQSINVDFPIKESKKSYVLTELNVNPLKEEKFAVAKYSDDSFNFHSWILVPPLLSPSFSLSAVSGNQSETIELQTGAAYRSTEASGGVFAQASFKKYLVQFDMGASFDKRASADFNDSDDGFIWDETNLYIGPKISSQINWGQWYARFFLAAYLNQVEILNKKNTDFRQFSDGKIQGGILRTGFDIQSAKNNLMPYSPLSVSFNYVLRDLKSDRDDERGKLSTVKSVFTLGVEEATGVRIAYGHEVQLENQYRFISELVQSRGFGFSYSSDFETFQFDIKRPIINSKFRLGKYAYFNRFDFGLFHDRMRYNNQEFSSTGAELTTNMYLFRTIPAPIGFGVRYLSRDSNDEYRDDQRSEVFEFFLSSVTTF